MRKLVHSVAGGLHVGKFVGPFFLEVIETAHKAHPGLAFDNGLIADVDGFHCAYQDKQGDLIDLINDIIRNTIVLSIPARGNLASNEAVETQSFGHQKSGILLKAYTVLS